MLVACVQLPLRGWPLGVQLYCRSAAGRLTVGRSLVRATVITGPLPWSAWPQPAAATSKISARKRVTILMY